MQIDESNDCLIKIMDEKAATALSTVYGFEYTKESINCGGTNRIVYVFKNSKELEDAVTTLLQTTYAQGTPVVYSNSLSF